jgi:hypothetical protein
MCNVSDRIFSIPEIDDMIINYLDPLVHLKKLARVNHHYHNVVIKNSLYTRLKQVHIKGKRRCLTYFTAACSLGMIDVVKYLFFIHKIKASVSTQAFNRSCLAGHLDVVSLLLNLQGVPCDLKKTYQSLMATGYLDIIILLHNNLSHCEKIGPYCMSGNLDIILWAHHMFINVSKMDAQNAFAYGCSKDHIDVVIWLYNMYTNIDIHSTGDYIFKNSCDKGNTIVPIWLTLVCNKYRIKTVISYRPIVDN